LRWWTAPSGPGGSAKFQQGSAQYHINADIAYAIRRYSNVQGNLHLLCEIGAEILVETARLWEDLGFYGTDKRFHIHGVTGPDEYTTVVNDNAYTNLMARLNLNFAAATVRRLREERPGDDTALVHAVRLQFKEVQSWERAAAAMYIPFDEKRGIHPPGSDVPRPGGVGPGRHAAEIGRERRPCPNSAQARGNNDRRVPVIAGCWELDPAGDIGQCG
jgi:alpha,alpha-trehalose phosphorylase